MDVEKSFNYSDAKILQSFEIKTPAGTCMVHKLDYEPERKNIIQGFEDFPELPEQYVAEFVNGEHKGMHTKQLAARHGACVGIEDALLSLMNEYGRRIAIDSYYAWVDNGR